MHTELLHVALAYDCDTSAEQLARVTAAAVASLASSGWSAETGALVFVGGIDGVAENPTATYAVYEFEQQPLPLAGDNSSWSLGPQDVVAWLGCTPPPAAYFSARTYIEARFENGAPVTLFASLGDSLNHLLVNTTAPTPWNATTLLLSTADSTSAAAVASAFAAAGLSRGAVNVDVVPSAVARLGYGSGSDALRMLLRVSLVSDAAAAKRYFATTWPVLRLRAPSAGGPPPAPFSTPPDRPRGSGRSEVRLLTSLAALRSAVDAAWSQRTPPLRLVLNETMLWLNESGTRCIDALSNCAGDNHDALYGASVLPFALNNGTVAMVVGVNHVPTLGLVYANVDVTDLETLDAAVAVTDASFAGSAAHFGGPTLPDMASLYAYAITRDCAAIAAVAGKYCLEVPETALPLNHVMVVMERAYLQLDAFTGPASEEVTPSTILLYSPTN